MSTLILSKTARTLLANDCRDTDRTIAAITEKGSGYFVVGVGRHKHIYGAAVMDCVAGILATLTIPTDRARFTQLVD